MKAFAVAALLLASCYSPEALDCTVSCSASDACGDGQVCGSDGFCADPAVAGHCGGPDGGMPSSLVSLRVMIDGPGKVTVETVGLCDEGGRDGCMFSVQNGRSLQLKAQAKSDKEFVGWMGACSGSSTTCTLTPVAALTQVGARFE
ncbi:MAG TPA: hypothetical protein VMZ53_17100 [Kofleriaceae bacterium]|nr:hypothetical protein [Kofleriaceae bacterium]